MIQLSHLMLSALYDIKNYKPKHFKNNQSAYCLYKQHKVRLQTSLHSTRMYITIAQKSRLRCNNVIPQTQFLFCCAHINRSNNARGEFGDNLDFKFKQKQAHQFSFYSAQQQYPRSIQPTLSIHQGT